MSGVDWVYKYIFTTKYFRIAKLRSEDRFQENINKYKPPRFIFEYSKNGYLWTQRTLLK